MEQEKEKLVFIDTDEDWDRKFRNLQAKYDCREEKGRRPSTGPLVAVVGLVALLAGGGLLAALGLFAS